MNSILGMTLDKVLIEKGEAHDKVTAELLMDKNKIADVFNDGWCDEFYIEFVCQQLEFEFKNRMKKYCKKKKIINTTYDSFIVELLFIHKEYKSVKNSKLDCEQLSFLWK
jgi:hypothetical protein